MHYLLLSLALMLGGCASVPTPSPIEVELRDLPALNIDTSVEIGESLVTKGKLHLFKGLHLQERITDNGRAREYIMEPHKLTFDRIDEDGKEYYRPVMVHYYVNDKTFLQRKYPSNAFLTRKRDGTLEMLGYFDLTTAGAISPAVPRHTVGKLLDESQPNFVQELIYGGRVGSQVKFLYREYTNDRVRAGFSQEVQYDLGDGATIGFKGVRIEIKAATNTKITYRLLRSFSDAQ
jgi:hypothetical protein